MNDESAATCSECFVNKPAEKKNEAAPSAAAPPAPSFSFGTTNNEKPAATTTTFSFSTGKVTTTTISFGAPMAEATVEAKKPEKADSDDKKWKCPCCETLNDDSSTTCSECFINRPTGKEKDEPVPESVQPKAFGGSSTDNKKATGSRWKCSCCDTVNEGGASVCSYCFAEASVHASVLPAHDSNSQHTAQASIKPTNADTVSSAPPPVPLASSDKPRRRRSFVAPRAMSASEACASSSSQAKRQQESKGQWRCPTCNTLNNACDNQCLTCHVIRP